MLLFRSYSIPHVAIYIVFHPQLNSFTCKELDSIRLFSAICEAIATGNLWHDRCQLFVALRIIGYLWPDLLLAICGKILIIGRRGGAGLSYGVGVPGPDPGPRRHDPLAMRREP